MDAEEAIWRRIIEAADERERADLHALSAERRRIIEVAREHYTDRITEEDQRPVHERSPLFVNHFFFPIRQMLGILRVHREPLT